MKKDWVLIVTDKGAIVYVRAYGGKSAAQKGLFNYLQEHRDYYGRKELQAVREWIKKHGERLNFDIVQQEILETAG